jgi:hypothetical protein
VTDGEARTWDEVRGAAIQAVRAAITAPWPDSDIEEVADAVLAVLDEEALNRLAQQYVEQSRLRSLGAKDGKAALDVIPAQEAIAGWCLAARGMLDGHGAENYTETSMEFPDRPRGERYVFILQRVGKLTPHEARRKAEAEADRLREENARLREQLEVVRRG